MADQDLYLPFPALRFLRLLILGPFSGDIVQLWWQCSLAHRHWLRWLHVCTIHHLKYKIPRFDTQFLVLNTKFITFTHICASTTTWCQESRSRGSCCCCCCCPVRCDRAPVRASSNSAQLTAIYHFQYKVHHLKCKTHHFQYKVHHLKYKVHHFQYKTHHFKYRIHQLHYKIHHF